jgi:hypothetical protein
LVVDSISDVLPDRLKAGLIDAGNEEPTGALHQLFCHSNNLSRRLALAENHLRQVVAQGAVVIYLGEADVLIGQIAQFFQGVFNRSGAAGYRC